MAKVQSGKMPKFGVLTLLRASLCWGVIIFNSCISYASEIEFNGFGSMYGAQAVGSSQVYQVGLKDKRFSPAPFSRIGLNLGSRISDDYTISAQLVASGSGTGAYTGSYQTVPDWNLQIKWAYLTYIANKNLIFKVGRQMVPDFLAAEFAEVGFLQPYRDIPIDIKEMIATKQFMGGLARYSFALPMGELSTAIFYGRSQYNQNSETFTSSFDLPDVKGISLTLEGDGYKVRGLLNHCTLALNSSSYVPGPGGIIMQYPVSTTANLKSSSLSFSVDKHNVVLWSEYGKVRGNDGTQTANGDFLEEIQGWYALAGYRLGGFLPRYLYAASDWSKLNWVIPYGKTKTHNFGLNYQVNTQFVVKADYKLTIGEADTKSYAISANTLTADQHIARTISLGVDFIY